MNLQDLKNTCVVYCVLKVLLLSLTVRINSGVAPDKAELHTALERFKKEVLLGTFPI